MSDPRDLVARGPGRAGPPVARILYHATGPEAAVRIRREGFRLDVARRSDAGDFGRGLYLTGDRARAAVMDRTVLAVDVRLEAPLVFASTKAAYGWLREDVWPRLGHTVRGSDREAAARRLADHLLAAGHDGLVVHRSAHGEARFWEVALYRPEQANLVEVSGGRGQGGGG